MYLPIHTISLTIALICITIVLTTVLSPSRSHAILSTTMQNNAGREGV